MPKTSKPSARKASQFWFSSLRQLVKASCGPGWILREHRGGRTQISRAWQDGTRSSVTVGLPWQAESTPALLVLVERLDGLLRHQQIGLAQAYELIRLEEVGGSTAALRRSPTDWRVAAERFHCFMVEETGRVKSRTWHQTYRRHIEQTLEVLSRKRSVARDGKSVLKTLLAAYPTPAGGAGRRERLGNAARFLSYAVDHCGVPERFRPPQDYRDLIGQRQEPKQPATPLLDHQFLALYQAITDPRWRLAVGLLGVFGLRPVELGCCRVEKGRLRVEGVKRNRSGCASARLVHGLDPAGGEGLAESLLCELHERGNAALPHAAVAAMWSTRVQQHLVRHVPAWREILDTAESRRQGHLTVYGLRHGYAFRGSQVYGLSPRVLSALMGHTAAVHLRHYGQWVGEEEIAAAVKAAMCRANSNLFSGPNL